MRRVWIAQCLCPARHAILAVAGEAEEETASQTLLVPLREEIALLLASGTINPFCGICLSPDDTWKYEVGRTRFRTMDEAKPSLRKSEAEQAEVRRFMDG